MPINPPTKPESQTAVPFDMAYVWSISLVAALGGLLFGYDWVVIGGAKPFFEKYFQLGTEELVGWANSCALVGCLLGSLVSGGLSDKVGRKKLLLAAALVFAVSSILTGWAYTFNTFVLWRIAGGVAIGMASNLSPMYIAEVAPAHIRGRLVAINQLTIVLGIVAAQVVNLLIAEKVPDGQELLAESWNCQFAWRWMFTAVTAPSLLFVIGAIWLPESPRWLIKSGMAERARQILARIGGRAYADEEVGDVEATLAAQEIQRVRFRDLLEPRMTKILLVGVVLAVLQQWSGINVIFNYAEELYKAAGYGVNDILFNIVITGAINLLVTAIAIGTVDRFGRRGLMLIGCASIAVSHILLGTAYLMGLKGTPVLVLTLCAIGSYGMSLAPITWVLISEIFPNRIRGAATSVAVSALWIACFILTYTFPLLKRTITMAGAFWMYAAICAAGFVFVLLRVTETKGKTLEQIERELAD
ncbi:MAG: sugar porter family MFS transporter [Thermoguttaceae bacterium]|jgi:sugar porter (SP) family MFS transporter